MGTLAAENQGQLTIDLTPVHQRKRSADDIARDLSKAALSVPGLSVYIQNPPAISIGGLQSKSLYQYTLQSGDIDLLNSAGRQLEARMKRLPILTGVTSDLLIENPQVTIDIDRDHAGQLGVTAAEIENTLYDAFGQRQVSTIYTPTNEYWVVMEVLPQYQQDIASLGSLYVRSGTSGAGSGAASPGNVGNSVAPSTGGPLVPLSAVATFHNDVGPVTVNHSGQLPSVTISFDLAPGVSLGTAISTIQKEASAILPPNIGAAFTGTAAAYESTQQNLLILIALAVFVIYLILGVLYESFVHPLTILSGLPFAAFGALLTLLVCGLDLDIYGLVGVIMLIGIVKKNAIMMIDFAIETERTGGKTPRAVDRRSRQRPVPADHDDDDGCTHGRTAHRARLGSRCLNAATAGCGGRGWLSVLAARDALRHAGVLHLSGRASDLV